MRAVAPGCSLCKRGYRVGPLLAFGYGVARRHTQTYLYCVCKAGTECRNAALRDLRRGIERDSLNACALAANAAGVGK